MALVTDRWYCSLTELKSELGEYSITYGGTRNESVSPFALSVAQAYQRIGV